MNTQDLQKKAEAIKQELLALKQKGYGNVDTSQIKGDLSSLPSLTPSPEKTLPESSPSNLLSFKDVLFKATNLAREKRNALSLSFMSSVAPSGTMAASDFNSILGNMNTASEKFIEEKTKGNTFKQMFVGDDLMEYELDPSGKVVGSGTKITSKPKDIETIETKSTEKLKIDARKKFGAVSSRIITELNEEQLREFMVDFDNTEKSLNASVDAVLFLDEWKKELKIGQPKEKESIKEQITNFLPQLKEAGFNKKEIKKKMIKVLKEKLEEVPDALEKFIDEEINNLWL